MLNFLHGKKTYIVAVLAGLSGVAQALGHPTPEWALTLLGAAGLGAVRQAIGR